MEHQNQTKCWQDNHLRRNHEIYMQGEGMHDEEVGQFRRRGFTKNGLDLTYNLTTTKLSLKICYQKVIVDSNESIQNFCVARK